MTSYDYDLAIIGSGGAAFAAAIRAAGLGARCALIERGEVGGTCVNIGCVPSKTLLAAAHLRHTAATNPFLGAPTSAGLVDLSVLVAHKDELVAELRQSKYLELADSYGFDILAAAACFADEDTVVLSDGRRLRAPSYLVATGAEPAVPDLPGLAEAGYLTSTTAMNLDAVPRRLVVIGGGFVGMEQGQLFAQLGASVTIVGRLAPKAEPEMAGRMTDIFIGDGIAVVADRALAVEPGSAGHTVLTVGGARVEADAILVATGRAPRLVDLDVARAGIELDDRGFIKVDTTQRTTNPKVYAAGDVAGGPQFVYAAATQGAVAADNAVGGAARTVDYRGLPSVIFTSPSLASAGLTEAEAIAAGHRCDCRVVELTYVPRAIANRDTRGAIKMVVDAATRNVLGVHVVAEGAGELMLAATYAIKFGLTVEQLGDTWAPYLTMSEGLKLTAQSFHRDIKQLSCCAA